MTPATTPAAARTPGPRYSFVVPIYRDGALAPAFCDALRAALEPRLAPTSLAEGLELIFVDDGSPDPASLEHLTRLATEHPWVRVVALTRNFGQHVAISCGYAHARGAWVGYLNVDQEDRPDQIPPLLDLIERGEHDIVVGVRRRRRGPLLDRLTSVAFNWLLNWLTGVDAPVNEATLRVMSRRAIDDYNQLQERYRFLPGLEHWLGLRRGHVEIEHQPRRVGRSSYGLRSRLRMGIESVISFSDLPLRWAAWLGLAFASLGLLAAAAIVVLRLFFVDFQAGWPSLAALMLLLGGLQIGVTGLASLYVGRILREVQGRPLYLVRRRWNFEGVGGAQPTDGAQNTTKSSTSAGA